MIITDDQVTHLSDRLHAIRETADSRAANACSMIQGQVDEALDILDTVINGSWPRPVVAYTYLCIEGERRRYEGMSTTQLYRNNIGQLYVKDGNHKWPAKYRGQSGTVSVRRQFKVVGGRKVAMGVSGI